MAYFEGLFDGPKQPTRAVPTTTAGWAARASENQRKHFGDLGEAFAASQGIQTSQGYVDGVKKHIIDELGRMASSDDGISQEEMMKGYSMLMRAGFPEGARKFLKDAKDMASMKKKGSGKLTKLFNDRVYDKDGNDVGRAAIIDGVRMVVTTNGVREYKEGEESVLHTQDKKITPNKLEGVRQRTVSSGQEIKRMQKYWETVKESPRGWKVWTTGISNAIRGVLGENYTDEGLAQAMSKGRMAGLVGAVKDQVFGGAAGVLSNQDVELIIKNIGGSVSAFRDPRVVGLAIKDILEQKVQSYNADVRVWNRNKRRSEPKKEELKLDIEKMFPKEELKNSKKQAVSPSKPLTGQGRKRLEELRRKQGR